jgi:gamma-resorcylate decarboxylase
MMGIALNAPAVQGAGNASEAVTLAKRANDLLAEQIAKRPDRFFGFAAPPMQDPEAAVLELQDLSKNWALRTCW